MRIPNRLRFAVQRLHSENQRVNSKIWRILEIDDLPAVEVEAIALTLDDRKRFLYQLVLFPPTDYFFVDGHCEPAQRERYLHLFRDAAHTFRRPPSLTPEPLPGGRPEEKRSQAILETAVRLLLPNATSAPPDQPASPLGAEELRSHAPDLDATWTQAYLDEAAYLVRSARNMAPIFDGAPGEPLHLGTILRDRYPGYNEATYGLVESYAASLRPSSSF